MNSKISFVGKIGINGLETKNPYTRNGKTKDGNDYHTFSCSIGNNNSRAFAEVFGMTLNEIATIDTDGNKISVNWSDRKDLNVIETVANFRKNTLSLDGNNYAEFISSYDFIDELIKNIDNISGKKFKITGQINKNIYNGTVSDRFTIQNMYLVDNDTKDELKATMEFFWNKDSIDDTDFKTEKKIYINGWVNTYIDKDNGNKYIPQQLVFDCSKLDLNDEKHIKLLNIRLNNLGLSFEDNKIKNNIKSGKIYSNMIITEYVNGYQREEFTIDMLTDAQKKQYEADLLDYEMLGEEITDDLKQKTLNKYRPSGDIYGARTTMYKIKNFDCRGNYEDGYVILDNTVSEFEDDIYIIPTNENVDDIINNSTDDVDDEDDDLFS